ncbi:hypothetical protein KIT04_118 [Vibrio phage KIT04]|nr:hypothetical protein KIT04_118 [Vibrio phage KIT04]
MKYSKPKSIAERQHSFHQRAKRAADDLAEEKPHILMLEEGENYETMMAQIRVFLCTMYGFSANGSAELIEKHLQVSIPKKWACVSGRM